MEFSSLGCILCQLLVDFLIESKWNVTWRISLRRKDLILGGSTCFYQCFQASLRNVLTDAIKSHQSASTNKKDSNSSS